MLNKRIKFLCLLIFIISLAITMSACDMGGNGVETEPTYYDLTIVVEGEGNTELEGTYEFEEGTTVDLTASPSEGWEFDYWEGNVQDSGAKETSILMESDETVTAVFKEKEIEPEEYELTIDIEGEGSTVPEEGMHEYEEGTTVDLEAIPDEGWMFDYWEGNVQDSSVAETSILMNSNETVTAVFEEEEVEEIVEFEDTNLEEAVREEINKPEGTLYVSDVINIITLDASEREIESIEGIQYLENLGWLQFGDNDVSNISPLANLTKLVGLQFGDNDVSDISPLVKLTNMEWLIFWSNEVSDISPLVNLTNLEGLAFSENEVSNIIPLENLTNLEELWFGWNEISNIGPLANLTNLEGLSFIFNEVSDISPLVENDGFGTGDVIDMRYNYLDLTAGSEDMNNIYTLIDRGVNVEFRPQN